MFIVSNVLQNFFVNLKLLCIKLYVGRNRCGSQKLLLVNHLQEGKDAQEVKLRSILRNSDEIPSLSAYEEKSSVDYEKPRQIVSTTKKV